MDSEYLFNPTTKRGAVQAGFGIALYQVPPGEVNLGDHQGVTGSWEEAQRWVDGDDNIVRISVYPLEEDHA